MARVYDENIIVEIPEGAHVCADNRVYIVDEKRYFPDRRYNMDVHTWIGKAISKTQMHPNNTYKERYQEEMQKIPHLFLPIYHKSVGLYAAVLSIAIRTGLYEDLIRYLGPESANLVMDYATYSIVTKSNAAKNFESEMARRMLFLGKAYSDSWIDEKFQKAITDDQISAFKDAWLKRSKPEDLREVWICVDGSNDDCTADIPEAEKGKAKSHKNIDIVSFLYAVTQDGTPITSQVYRGSRVDSRQLTWMVNYLKDYGITPKGFILDRGFCDESSIHLLQGQSYEYVIKLKENVYGFQQLLARYRDTLKFNWDYALGHGLYGTGETVQVFKSSSLKANCILIWDAKNGGLRIDYLVDELLDTISKAEADIAAGKKPSVPAQYSQYVRCIEETHEDKTVTYRLTVQKDLIQSDIREKGFYGLVVSGNESAGEANAVYNLRDSSEKQYSMLKSQLGGDTFRAHSMHGITVREMISFVASIIRNEMMKTCKASRPKLDVNKTIKELDFIMLDRTSSGNYVITPCQSEKQKAILNQFKVTDANLHYIAEYESRRSRGEMASPIQVLSDPAEENNPSDKSKTRRVTDVPKDSKAKGKGSRSTKSTVTAKSANMPVSSTAGSSTTEAAASALHRGPGRPKGSKNKPKDPNAEQPKRRPGRPKGSKNKPKEPSTEQEPKRGPGRPKGSKNKDKQKQ